jgi:hypothetical protein
VDPGRAIGRSHGSVRRPSTDALNTQATTKGNRYFGRLDFSRIGLMGHSRGGDGVLRAVKKIIVDPTLSGKYTVKTVCSLAPTDFTGSLAPAKSHVPERTANFPC